VWCRRRKNMRIEKKEKREWVGREKEEESSKNEGHPFIFFLSFCFTKDKGRDRISH